MLARRSLAASPVAEILVEESIAGWKEFELEVMRDGADNAVVVCSIENVDPMGVHTGDSVTVAPQQTLTDREYQAMRDDALACLRAVGVETGGSNVQFAVDPATGRRVLIEMNPRVSRSSALASKATGFPIAKIAALLAVGYRLDEIRNDITGATPASFEPTLDYVVIKVPRFAFEKFPEADAALTSTMKSVGEVMAIGRTFKEALGKAWRGLEKTGSDLGAAYVEPADGDALALLRDGTDGRFHLIERALDAGHSVDEIASASSVDPWFVDQMAQVWEEAVSLRGTSLDALGGERLFAAKRAGLSDARIARETGSIEIDVRARRESLGIVPVFKSVDTCGGEFPAHTPYHYSTYEEESEVTPAVRPRVVILGAGPNRIGQGIEFDYACVHAAFALDEAGFDSVMINSNPETVSTDYDTSSRLYFEPLTAEDVLAVCQAEQPVGVIAQLGGQTPLELARILQGAGFRILGTSPDAIDLAEDRGRFAELLQEMEIPAPPHGEARTIEEARVVARRIGYPVVVRPSYVLGGRAMEIVYDDDELETFVRIRGRSLPRTPRPDRSFPGGGDRGRRRRRLRRRRRVHRRGDGAHRGGRCPLRRLLVPDPARDALRRGAGPDRGHHPPPRAADRGGRAPEPAARRQGREDLGARGESPSVAYRAVRVEGDRRLARPRRDAGAGREDARRAGVRGGHPGGCDPLPRVCPSPPSKRRCSRSAGSPAWTRSSDRRCARPVR